MRWSKLFIPTLREAPGDAEAESHKLLVRGGFIRQLHSGHYSMLPLGRKVHEKVASIVREEMDSIGAQEFLLPAMHPKSLWEKSGRWTTMGDEMFRLEDRHGTELGLGMTHEEVFASIATELTSWRSLPQIWYQVQLKFRDEPRPKAGLLRVREFAMKDSYSFDIDEAGLDKNFDLHHDAYLRIFERLDLDAMPVQASSGAMGGTGSIEFMVASPAGEDDVVRCGACGYHANVETARSAVTPAITGDELATPEKFATPGLHSIADIETLDIAATGQIKTLVMVIDGEPLLVVLRGDHQLNEQKLIDGLGASQVRPASHDEAVELLGAKPGSLGPIGIPETTRVIADAALEGLTGMVSGANEDGFHLRGIDVARDITVAAWFDLREVTGGEPCPSCGSPLEVVRTIEAGHIFKLGTQYSEAMGAQVLDPDGNKRTIVMGSYGIGVGRNMAAVAETHFDDKGLTWPVNVAPYEACVTVMRIDDEETMRTAETIYSGLRARGIDVVIDDRDARAGVKFADCELIGIPHRITVGPRGVKNGMVEHTHRQTLETVDVSIDEVVEHVTTQITQART